MTAKTASLAGNIYTPRLFCTLGLGRTDRSIRVLRCTSLACRESSEKVGVELHISRVESRVGESSKGMVQWRHDLLIVMGADHSGTAQRWWRPIINPRVTAKPLLFHSSHGPAYFRSRSRGAVSSRGFEFLPSAAISRDKEIEFQLSKYQAYARCRAKMP
jgi:hypothetical protein